MTEKDRQEDLESPKMGPAMLIAELLAVTVDDLARGILKGYLKGFPLRMQDTGELHYIENEHKEDARQALKFIKSNAAGLMYDNLSSLTGRWIDSDVLIAEARKRAEEGRWTVIDLTLKAEENKIIEAKRKIYVEQIYRSVRTPKMAVTVVKELGAKMDSVRQTLKSLKAKGQVKYNPTTKEWSQSTNIY